ncbi:lysophospholipid acyltransferase family protein [Photorhabdus viridis]|uniref:lysophospholipid acyltransferase family protein n=1 Tax=Photorhabdus viridis TaxID=3163327 RepID=UPI003307914C
MNRSQEVTLVSKGMGSFLSGLCRLLTGVSIRWIGCKPSVVARIYYANHTSHLDGLVIWAGFPRVLRYRVHPVAARDYWSKTGLRRYFINKVFRAVLIDRKGEDGLKENTLIPMEDVLRRGESLILFPEGTRGNGEQINKFKGGLYYLAKKYPDVELIPVYLENLNRVLPKGSALVVPVICSATFGRPLEKLGEKEEKADFLQRARLALEALIL